MAIVMGFSLNPDKPGLFDLSPEIRQKIYRYLHIDHRSTAIPIFRMSLDTADRPSLAISPCSLSAQLLRTCHQILEEAYHILYTKNSFTLYIDNNSASPRAIPLLLASGNLYTLGRITISIHSVRELKGDLQDLLLWLPGLRLLEIDGNLLRTIDFYRPFSSRPDTPMQRCVDQSNGLLFSAFGGKEMSRRFLDQRPSLAIEYTFGVAVDLILPATGEVVKGVPQWHTEDVRQVMVERYPQLEP